MMANAMFAAPAPVCVPPPTGQCPIIMQPGCVYSAEHLMCAAKPVPVMGDVVTALVLLAVILVGYLGLRGTL